MPVIAITAAATISIAATAKVIRMPAATTPGPAVTTLPASVAAANTEPMTEAPVTRPRFRDRFSRPEMTPR
jgi:hypothetical protein